MQEVVSVQTSESVCVDTLQQQTLEDPSIDKLL